MTNPQRPHFRVPEPDSCLWQSIHAFAAFRSDRIILQKKMPRPTVARHAIARRRMTTCIFVASTPQTTIIALGNYRAWKSSGTRTRPPGLAVRGGAARESAAENQSRPRTQALLDELSWTGAQLLPSTSLALSFNFPLPDLRCRDLRLARRFRLLRVPFCRRLRLLQLTLHPPIDRALPRLGFRLPFHNLRIG